MISVIIPVLNEAHTIGNCLNSVRAGEVHHEIIVVDGGSTDDTLDIVGGFSDVTKLKAPKGRGCQMNRGAEVALGDILLFLHADTCLPPNGLTKIESLIKEREDITGGSFWLDFDHNTCFLRLYALFSRINHILFTYGDQGLFLRKPAFEAIGGFRNMPIMEDVEIQTRLRPMGRFVKIRHPVTTSARRFLARGILRQQMVNIGLVCLYHGGVSPVSLKRLY